MTAVAAESASVTAVAHDVLGRLLQAALRAADPTAGVQAHLPPRPAGRTVVIGAGKAAAVMAAAVEAAWDGPLSGLVICPYGHSQPTSRITVREAAHPVPDSAGFRAATELLKQLDGLSADDLVLVLLSGGGSALMSLPAPGLSLDDKRLVTQALLLSGAPIDEINLVRKFLSAVKGGQLALAAAPAQVVTLALSDVPGDDPAVIASGPTVGTTASPQQALDIIRRTRLEIPFAVIQYLRRQASLPAPDDPRLARCHYQIIGRPLEMLQAAEAEARTLGLTPLLLGDAIEGESREIGKALAGMALSAARHRVPLPAPCVLLSGGETTVTVRQRGRGGPNCETALAAALTLRGHPRIAGLCVDTDGADGQSGAAGARFDPTTLERCQQAGLDPRQALDRNDSAPLFTALGDLVETGPTRTNVNDFRALLVL